MISGLQEQPPDDAEVFADNFCRECDEYGLILTYRKQIVLREVGTHSLAGNQVKFSGFEVWWPYCICPHCNAESRGK